MSDGDQLTNSAELNRLRGSLLGVAVPEPPALDAIMARGRSWRRHRRYRVAGVFLVGAAIAAALVVGPPVAPAAGPAAPPSGRTLGTIRTAAYTIVLNSDDTATLTIDATELIDPAKLQSDLDKEGIPAKVTVGSFCTSDPAPAGLSQVVSFHSAEQSTITIDPTAMPAGAELSFGEFGLRQGVEMATYGLVDKGSYTCSTTPPTSSPSPSSGAMFLIGSSDAP